MSEIPLGDVTVSSRLEIFILEDDPIFQKRMLGTLSDIGFEGRVTVCGTISEAKSKFLETMPGFIFSDWNLPDGFGIEFLKAVRSERRNDLIPFLMVTTMDAIDNILEAVTSGADGYVVKPWEEEDLIEKMSFAFEKRQNQAT